MDKVGKKLVKNIKSAGRYEVMDGINSSGRIDTLSVPERVGLNAHSYSTNDSSRNGNGTERTHSNNSITNNNHRNYNYDTTSSKKSSKSSSSFKVREPGADIEMTAAVSGVVPDGM